MQALKAAGSIFLDIAAFLALLFLMALWISGVHWVSEKIVWYVWTGANIALWVCLLVLLPLLLLPVTRKVSCFGIFGASADSISAMDQATKSDSALATVSVLPEDYGCETAHADTISALDQATKSDSALATVSVLSEDNGTTQDAFPDQAQGSDWEVAATYLVVSSNTALTP
jgi:hypothetical protein